MGKQAYKPHEEALHDIGQHGIEAIGNPIAFNPDFRVKAVGQPAVFTDKLRHLETAGFIGGIAVPGRCVRKGLHQRQRHCRSQKQQHV